MCSCTLPAAGLTPPTAPTWLWARSGSAGCARNPPTMCSHPGCELVHASLRDPLYTFMDKPADIYLNLPLASQPTVLFGHSHQSACFAATERGLPTSLPTDIDVAQPLPYGRTCLLNPGCGCDEEGARWLELQLDGAERIAIWRQTAVSGHGGLFSITP